jgi:hypothetical protein
MVFLAMCLLWIFVFSSIAPLENTHDVERVAVEKVDESFVTSKIDYSAIWNRTYGGFDQDRFYDMTACDDGGYAYVGYAESFAADYDIWVVRTDSNGDVVWTTYLSEAAGNDIGRGIIECENGDLVVVGNSYPAGDNQARIDRLDSDGNIIWTKLVGEIITQDYFYDVVESESGSILAVGQTESWGAGGNDVLALCLAPNGNEIWMRTYGGAAGDSGISVTECASGGFAILGETQSFGEGLLDFWLIRIDNDGNELWEETFGGSDVEYVGEVIELRSNGFLLAGSTESLGDPMGNLWAVKVDDSGTEVWNHTYVGAGQDFATGVVESIKGGFAIVGIADFISGVDQTRITRIDTDGVKLWSDWYGGPTVDYGYAIVETHPEEYVVDGTTNSYGSGAFDGWTFLVPGEPVLDDPPSEAFYDYGQLPSVTIPVYSTAQIHTSYISGSYSDVFNVVHLENEVHVYTFDVLDVGFYDLFIHINNTAGHEIMHILWICVDDTTSPTWSAFTAEHFLEFGEQFLYTPIAYDLSLLDEWFLTGSTYFTIDSGSGEISNVGTPPVGEYNLEIQVNDRYHNSLLDSLQIVVQDTTDPTWDIVIEDQSIDYGEDFVYDLAASDLAGIASWSVDNTEFSVESEGRVRNLITLVPGVHAVTVTVTDVNGNNLKGMFTVTVGNRPPTTHPTTPPTGGPAGIFDSVLPFAVGVGATLFVVAVVCALGRRKPSGSK